MDEKEKETIDKYYYVLLQTLNVSPRFLASLHENYVINDKQRDNISGEKDARECRRVLINHMKTSTKRGVFQSFMKALSDSQQHDIKKDLENHPQGCTLEKKREQWEWQIRLRKFQGEMVERLICRSEFLTVFLAEKHFTEYEMQTIEFEVSEERKTFVFLNILQNKPPKACRTLIDALRKDENYIDLADKIVKYDIVADDREQFFAEKVTMKVEEMLLAGFEVKPGCKVSLQNVVTHLEIQYRKCGERFPLDKTEAKEHLKSVFNGLHITNNTVHNLTISSGFEKEDQKNNASGIVIPMETWDSAEVVKWLREVDIGNAQTIEAVENHNLTGEQLMSIDLDNLCEIVPSKGRCICIIEERDKCVKSQREALEFPAMDEASMEPDEQTRVIEPFRKFDSSVDITEVYQQHSRFPSTPTRPTNLIEPIRRFVPLQIIDTKGPSFTTLVNEVVRFGAACLNDLTNGVIYFGVREGEIIGLDVQCDKTYLDEMITKKIKQGFHTSQWSKVLKCIRPIRWMQVRGKAGPMKKFVIEVDVEPTSELCGEDVFLIKPENDLYTFGEKGPSLLDRGKFIHFFSERPKVSSSRKKKESIRNMKNTSGAHQQDLIKVLCRGSTHFREGEYPILVLPPADIGLKPETVENKFAFLRYIEWKAVFDFGADRTFLNYMNKQERLFKIRDVEEFDADGEDATTLKNTREDAYNGHVPNWILMNGDVSRGRKPKDLKHWKKLTEDGCSTCFKTYTKGFKTSRVLVIFLLHSPSTEVFADACVQLCVQSENYACLAENETIAKKWQADLMKYHYIEKIEVEKRLVAGLPWEYVGEIVKEITNNEPHAMCKVPTSIGEQALTIKKELYDLCVVGSNECSNSEILYDPEKRDEFLKMKEAEFYKGGKVDWWNFWSHGVCERDIFKPLCKKIRSLFREGVEGEIELGIKTHRLYHQPGSGGTTCARHVLWEFRQEVKCAEIVHLTGNTCSQIVKLREFGEPNAKDPDPLLLLIDNADREKTLELLTDLKKHSEMRDRYGYATKQAYCVCLIVDRRSNVTGKLEQYHCLYQKLSTHEQVLFKKQSDKIQEKHPIDTLIAFNIMKANFDHDVIQDNVSRLIKDISNQEQFLLKYLSFLNVYDISQKCIECSAFDEVMATDACPAWEEHISEALRVLVVMEKSDEGHRVIKSSHYKLSEQILECMKKDELLSNFTMQLLKHRFLGNKVSYAILNLRRHLAGVVKQRGTDGKGYRERFAPLILQINQDESWEESATVMQKMYEITDDAFVAQQLARLHIESQSWEAALMYSSMAISKYSDNYHLLDTKGQVFRHKLEKFYASHSGMPNQSTVTVESMLDKVEEAYQANTIFRDSQQKLSYALNARGKSAKPTISGQLGELQIYASILENLTLLTVFTDESNGSRSSHLVKFLHDPQYIPPEIRQWDNASGTDYISYLKSIPHEAKETLRCVEDFDVHLNQGFIKSKDTDHEEAIETEKRAIKGLKKRLYPFILNTEGACSGDILWLLEGTSFNSIFQSLGIERHLEQETSNSESQGWKTRCMSTLGSLLDNAKDCLRVRANDFEALECLISSALIIALYFGNTDLVHTFTHQDLLHWSRTLFATRNSKPTRLEPYLYYVMLHWPKAGDTEGQRSVSEAIASWKELYCRKNPNIMANHAFYFTKGAGLQFIAHRAQLYNHKKHRGDKFWKDEEVKQRLKRFTGILGEDGREVFLLDENTKETTLKIPTRYPIHDSSLWRNAVTFPIVFTFMGPKAYDVQRK